jgi:hypothetical protein
MQLAVKEWRARFSVENREARVVGSSPAQRHRSWQAGTSMTCARPTANAAAGGQISVAYYFGKLTGTDLAIDAGA